MEKNSQSNNMIDINYLTSKEKNKLLERLKYYQNSNTQILFVWLKALTQQNMFIWWWSLQKGKVYIKIWKSNKIDSLRKKKQKKL